MKIVDDIFLKHPRESNMTYLQHMCFTCSIGYYFCFASIQAHIHACIPCLCEKSSEECSMHINSIAKRKSFYN